VLDDVLRHPDDAPSIGLILCKEKKALSVEYALRGSSTPIGVSEYLITERLPDELRASLPTAEQLEAEFAGSEELEPEELEPIDDQEADDKNRRQ